MDKPIRETIEAVTDPVAAARPDEGASELPAPAGADRPHGSDPGSSETIAGSAATGATSAPDAIGIGFDDA